MNDQIMIIEYWNRETGEYSVTIPAGRELDALIAENIFGWTWSQEKHRVADPDGYSIRKLLIPPNGEWILRAYELEPGMNSVRIPIPPYSTDIAAAWEVVEKLKMTVSAPTAPYADGEYANSSETEWEVEVTKLGSSDWSDIVSARALTAPHAICLAALKAVGHT